MPRRDVLAKPRAGGVKQSVDVIIVGGGSAGAVLAGRLSADAHHRVKHGNALTLSPRLASSASVERVKR